MGRKPRLETILRTCPRTISKWTVGNRERHGTPHAAALAVVLACIALARPSAAQTGPIVARAASVTGTALVFSGGAGSSFVISAGVVLNPGDRIDTRSGGRVVIDLSDGSMVVVEPQSVIVLKNFRDADSLRELFEILAGKVRVKINHFGGRPNPYRMNSPTASIAVRGTEFSIEVSPSGDTQVVVYEGVVQVTSLSDPSQTILLEAGRGVLVQPGQDLHLLGVAANQVASRQGSEDQQRRSAQSNQGYDQQSGGAPTPNYTGANSDSQSHADYDGASLRATASAYDNYMSGLSNISQVPFQLRFNALREAHLDSLENPAYATQFEAPEGRLFALPAFGGPGSQGNSQTYAGSQSGDYSVTPQFSIFSPVGHTGFFAGGSVSATLAGDSSLTAAPDEDAVNSALTRLNGRSTGNFYSGSLVLAHKIGAASSFGLEVEALRGNGSLSSTTTDYDTQTAAEQISSVSRISQTRLTAGFSQDLSARTKLGIFYRYGFISATDHDLSHTLNGSPLSLNSTGSAGHSSEIGFRLRGQIRPKLSYGITGSWMGIALGSDLVRTNTVNSYEFDRAQRGSAGAGISYYLRPRVLFTFDASAGTSRVAAQRVEDAAGNTLQNGSANSHVFATHAAVQLDLTRKLFVNLSYLHAWHAQQLNVNLFPDQTGATVAVQDSFFPTAPSAYQLASHLSDFGLGWRFSPQLFAQYVFSTDYGATAPTHSLAFRYVFRQRKTGLEGSGH